MKVTCKDCIETLKRIIGKLGWELYAKDLEALYMAIDVLKKLEQQKYIKLPCKVGDTAWYISIERYIPLTYKIKEAKVVNFRADCNGIFEFELETEKSTFLVLYEYVYFDKSKAEEKLKELNNNELQRSNRKS